MGAAAGGVRGIGSKYEPVTKPKHVADCIICLCLTEIDDHHICEVCRHFMNHIKKVMTTEVGKALFLNKVIEAWQPKCVEPESAK